MQTVKDISFFLKKRALIEEEYGRQMIKLTQTMSETVDKAPLRTGTLSDSWSSYLKVHEKVGENRVRFSQDIVDISDDLLFLHRDTEKERKQIKDLGIKHEKLLGDADIALEKVKQRYDQMSEEWEKAILQKNGETVAVTKKAIFKSNKTQAQLGKIEEEARTKAGIADQAYRHQLKLTNQSRNEYYTVHLPKIITDLKAVGDECCVAMRYQLARYAYRFEQALVSDGMEIDPEDGDGLRSLAEKIDHVGDLNGYIQSCQARVAKVQKLDIPFREYSMSASALQVLNPNPVFGVSLDELMERTGAEVPLIVLKCTAAVELYGLHSTGIYRLSGTNSQILKLKTAFDRGNLDANAVDFNSEEYMCDVNNITSVLKLWFRELPDPLLPRHMYNDFISKAIEIGDERKRVLAFHTLINELSDAHYSTLKHLMCHLNKIQANEEHNRMGISNLATIFGLTLMGNDTDDPRQGSPTEQDNRRLAEMQYNVCVVHTILEYYDLIFE
ncbi:Rho GTPase activation protein [Phycomyces blakesleeanus]